MATVNAYNGFPLNMSNLNLSNEATYGIERNLYSNMNFLGSTYPDAYEVEMDINGTYYDDYFLGNFFHGRFGCRNRRNRICVR